jgi:hypothetical protein
VDIAATEQKEIFEQEGAEAAETNRMARQFVVAPQLVILCGLSELLLKCRISIFRIRKFLGFDQDSFGIFVLDRQVYRSGCCWPGSMYGFSRNGGDVTRG